jgi:hypothetical protein
MQCSPAKVAARFTRWTDKRRTSRDEINLERVDTLLDDQPASIKEQASQHGSMRHRAGSIAASPHSTAHRSAPGWHVKQTPLAFLIEDPQA